MAQSSRRLTSLLCDPFKIQLSTASVPSRCFSTSVARRATSAQTKLLGSSLRDSDSEIYEILENEKKRQRHFINLIPSENFTSLAVLEALGSVMQSKLILKIYGSKEPAY